MNAKKGSFADFYKLVNLLIPNFNKFVVERSAVSLVYEGLKLVPVYLVKLIIDNVLIQHDIKQAALLTSAIFGILLLLTFVEMSAYKSMLKKVVNFQKMFLERAHKKIVHLPLSFHERQSTGAMVSRINKGAHYLTEVLWFVNNDIIPTFLQIILTSILLFFTEWHIGLIYLCSLPFLLWYISEKGKKVQPFRERYHKSFDAASGELAQTLYNVRTVKDYSQEQKEYKTYSGLLEKYTNVLLERFAMERWFITWRETATNAVRVGTMFLAAWFVIKGALTPGDLVLVFTLTEKAFASLHRVGRVYNLLGDAHESLSRVHAILEEPNTLHESLSPVILKKTGGNIEVRRVRFSYGTEAVLKDISFVIPPKKLIALIGESGSGKTTVIKLLARHYDPIVGNILLDGVDLRRLSLRTVRRKIAVVSQHTEIFNRTIHENIAYGKPNATRREVIEAAKKANAHEFITSFKKGYDTLVGEKGVRLSGGQQQRISIARALLADPEILIFDEATSSLDSKSEMNIQKAIFAARGKYTIIIIAHRLSTIEHADIVVVMHEGKIAEIGTPKKLLQKGKGLYKRMRELQRLGEIRK